MQSAESAIDSLKSIRFVPLILLACAAPGGASTLFEEAAVIDVRLTGPIASLIEKSDAHPELSFLLEADGRQHSVAVRVRGKSRTELCKIPPLRINFSESDTAGTVFAGQDKLKLVTHCKKADSYRVNVLEEYAAYRIFNLLSDVGFRVRLLRITYVDTDARSDDESERRYGFFIETTDELASRIGGRPVEAEGVRLGELNAQQAATVYIFHYLIGNTDWSLVTADGDDYCCHNGELFAIGEEIFVVPYDFDLSGLVNAKYAKPLPEMRISRVTQRRYRGYCIATDALTDSLRAIVAKQAEILGVIEELPDLSDRDIRSNTKYLRQFFDKAKNEEKLIRRFEQRCL